MAEIELATLTVQCLGRRIGSRQELEWEVAAWEEERNERQVEVQWQFTTAEARIKLRRLFIPRTSNWLFHQPAGRSSRRGRSCRRSAREWGLSRYREPRSHPGRESVSAV
jgi:hypothetical protein